MLRFLRVSNLAVVLEVSIELEEGLTVLTGETGAGKSIFVDALSLLLGGRSSSDLIRTGARAASVEGIFRVDSNPAALAILADLGIETDDGDLVLRRELSAGGKGRAFVNGALHPVATLRRLGPLLADVYGQHEHVRLMDPSTHLDLLDHFAGLAPLRHDLATAYRRLGGLEARFARLVQSESERARRADFLRFELGEIDAARVVQGEDEDLDRERRVLANHARILELAEGSYQVLYEADGSILERLGGLARDLAELAEIDATVRPPAAEVESARVTLEDVALTLRDYARDIPQEADRLEAVQARLAVLDRLKAKYGPSLGAVQSFADEARKELQTLELSDEERVRLEEELGEARIDYGRMAAEASAARKAAAGKLERRVESEVAELAMENTRFRVRLSTEEAEDACFSVDGRRLAIGPAGVDRAEFDVSTNVGEEPKPLVRVASGGELARLLLALRTVAADHEPSRIAVFHALESGLAGRVTVLDEVDAGIGGRVAYVLARKLHRLARGRQVLCVTHLAPIAAAADRQLRVRKEERRGRTEVMVERLAGTERIEELGRMIGGDAVTDTVRRHAEELLSLLPEKR